MFDSGFVKAYHYLVKQGMIDKVKPPNKKKPKAMCDIVDEFEDVFCKMCDAWDDYSDETDEFDAGAKWENICDRLVNRDNIHEFFD